MNKKITLFLAALALLPALSSCGGKSKNGDRCDTAGSVSDCEDGTICTNATNGNNYCRKLCTSQSDCGTGENCNGISNTNLKSCQM